MIRKLLLNAALRRAERVARAIDPVAWAWIDRQAAKDLETGKTHPALQFTRDIQLRQARRAITAMFGG